MIQYLSYGSITKIISQAEADYLQLLSNSRKGRSTGVASSEHIDALEFARRGLVRIDAERNKRGVLRMRIRLAPQGSGLVDSLNSSVQNVGRKVV
jgi:hypothetical protein